MIPDPLNASTLSKRLSHCDMMEVQTGDYVVTCLAPEYLRKSGCVRLSKGQMSAKRLMLSVLERSCKLKTSPENRRREREHLLDKIDEGNKRIQISNDGRDYWR